MTSDNKRIAFIRDKIIKGMDLTIKKLLKTKSERNADIIISDNGKIIKVKAKDLI